MGRYPVPLDYTWDMRITSFDVGQDRKLKLSSQLKLQQEVGERQFEQGGLGFEELVRNGLAFVITRTNSVIHRRPEFNQEIRLTTWHRSSKGVQFFRCYQFYDKNGEPLIESVSAFVLVDPDTHKILRPSVFSSFAVTEQPDRLNGCPDPEKCSLPNGLQSAGFRDVRWSDTDYNGHLNNAVYADIIMDALPRETRNRDIKGFTISFLNEALEGEIIELAAGIRHGESGDRAWVSGSHSRGRCFDACVSFKPE
ncbi:MAG: hypothetical protein GX136_03470 [Clostridiales bacterium]|nr:hypothetical protein [Clostridiales bacterium]